jgi:hypothetical protein
VHDVAVPIDWTIDHEKRLIEATARGSVSAEEMRRYLDDVARAGCMPYAKIFDLADATTDLAIAEVQTIGRSIRQYVIDGYGPLGPLAIVAGNGRGQFHAAGFADSAGTTRPLRIFKDRDAAFAWFRSLGH